MDRSRRVSGLHYILSLLLCFGRPALRNWPGSEAGVGSTRRGEEDQIRLYGLEWSGLLPDQAGFENLLDAARAIDAWIVWRL